MAANISTVPDHYDGREQAWIKHQLLESYFEKLLLIIGMAARQTGRVEICYVDCFAGPWGDGTEHLEGTSIAISLRTMAMCKLKLAKLGVNATMRSLYIEMDNNAYARLSTYLESTTPPGVEAQCLHGDFLALRGEILSWCGPRAFTFFFIDPKGWKTVGIENLRPLLMRPRSEFLINFMYDFINRTASMQRLQQDIADFLAQPVAVVQGLVGALPQTREAHLVGSYRDGLKSALPMQRSRYQPRTAYVRVLAKNKERPMYHLIYLTCHPRGLIAFMEISQGVSLIQQRVRATKRSEIREEKTGIKELFDVEFDAVERAAFVSPQEVDQFWLGYLSTVAKVVDEDAFADILEQTDWMPADLQSSLLRLIGGGRVHNLDSKTSRHKRPLHFEKRERLMLTAQKSR